MNYVGRLLALHELSASWLCDCSALNEQGFLRDVAAKPLHPITHPVIHDNCPVIRMQGMKGEKARKSESQQPKIKAKWGRPLSRKGISMNIRLCPSAIGIEWFHVAKETQPCLPSFSASTADEIKG
jgi:hypothetical protein